MGAKIMNSLELGVWSLGLMADKKEDGTAHIEVNNY
jgi:hypothetical protein